MSAEGSRAVPRSKVRRLDLVPQYEAIRDEIEEAIEAVLAGQQFILGASVRDFEREFARYCGTRFAVGVASGSDAILLSLMACGTGEGDEVITTPYTFFSTVSSITRLGAKPVLVDIDPSTYNMDPEPLGEAPPPSLEIVSGKDIAVIEDACQSIGALYRGRKVGSIGKTGCFSFFPSKNLGGFGDGGMVTTDDEDLMRRLSSLRVHGSSKRYYHEEVGINSRLDALQAAVLRVKLGHLDRWNEGRRRNAARYGDGLKGFDAVEPAAEAPYGKSVYNQYVIRAERRDGLMEFLRERDVGCEIYYPLPLHQQECFAFLGYSEGDFPESERAAAETLALPVYPELEPEQIDYVIETIGKFYGGS